MSSTVLNPLVPIETVARKFTVSVSTVRAWLRNGYIPKDAYVKVGNTYRFDVEKIMAAFANRETVEQPDTPKSDDPFVPMVSNEPTNTDEDL